MTLKAISSYIKNLFGGGKDAPKKTPETSAVANGIMVTVPVGFDHDKLSAALETGDLNTISEMVDMCSLGAIDGLTQDQGTALSLAVIAGFEVDLNEGFGQPEVVPVEDPEALAEMLVDFYQQIKRHDSAQFVDTHPFRTPALLRALNKNRLTKEQADCLLRQIPVAYIEEWTNKQH